MSDNPDTKAALERKAVGNAAAMREALIKCYQLAYEWEANEREGIAGVEPDAKDSTETLFDIQQITTAALDSPPRNCDRFADAETARRAWLDDAENWDEFGSPKLELHEWLFAPATEQKGDNDGSK